MNQFNDDECLLTTQKHCSCIEFILGERERHGFHASQLLHYRLAANDTAGKDAPPEKLTIAFATADVTLTGWRLERVVQRLRDGDLLAVRARPDRYAHLDRNKPYVASIAVEPISKG